MAYSEYTPIRRQQPAYEHYTYRDVNQYSTPTPQALTYQAPTYPPPTHSSLAPAPTHSSLAQTRKKKKQVTHRDLTDTPQLPTQEESQQLALQHHPSPQTPITNQAVKTFMKQATDTPISQEEMYAALQALALQWHDLKPEVEAATRDIDRPARREIRVMCAIFAMTNENERRIMFDIYGRILNRQYVTPQEQNEFNQFITQLNNIPEHRASGNSILCAIKNFFCGKPKRKATTTTAAPVAAPTPTNYVTRVGSAFNIKQIIQKLAAELKAPNDANFDVILEELYALVQCFIKGKWKVALQGDGLFDPEVH
jgi:hypothetical protein